MENSNIFTVRRRTMASGNSINYTKQILMLFILLGLVIAIPLFVFSLLKPEGFFETRRKAAQNTIFYGYLELTQEAPVESFPDNFRNDNYYYFADDEKRPINFGDSGYSPKYILITKTNLEKLLADSNYSGISRSKTYSIQNVNTSPINLFSAIELLLTDNSSTIIETNNRTPAIYEKDTNPKTLKIGQPFTLEYRIEDVNTELGDLIRDYSVTTKYADDSNIQDWGLIINPNFNTIFNHPSPISLTIAGTPPESSIGKILKIVILGNELVNKSFERSFELEIKENAAPIINSISFHQDGTLKTGDNKHLFRPIFNSRDQISGQIKVYASDNDDTDLTYSFSNIPEIFISPTIEDNTLNFQINWEDLSSYFNTYDLEVTISDGIESISRIIETGAVKAYTEKDPPCLPEDDGCEPWSANFDYSINAETNQVEFTRRDDIEPSEDIIEKYWWIFGDGIEIHGEKSVTHTYSSAGDYYVTLVISDRNNAGIGETKKISINSSGDFQKPTASFVAFPKIGTAPLKVRINPESSYDSDGHIISYHWDFGDGQKEEHNSPMTFEHIYNVPGVYSITLTVTDNDRVSAQLSEKITVGYNSPPSVLITRPNQGVYGGGANNPNNRINWLVSDAENDSPLEYYLYLIPSQSGGSCTGDTTRGKDSYILSYGNLLLSSGQYLPSVFEWNTQTSRSGTISDGYYCIKLAVIDNTYGHISIDYSDNPVEVNNSKHKPYFTTDLIPNAIKGVYYSTKITARDEDSNVLVFSLEKGPEWIEVTGEGEIKGTPTISGPQLLTVKVTDNDFSVYKTYNINVLNDEKEKISNIILGTNIEVFVGNSGKITWIIDNFEEISKLDLQYSSNGEEWNDLAQGLSRNIREYSWDVSDLEDGIYLVRILYYNNKGEIAGSSSIREIEVSNPKTQNDSEPLVYGTNPRNNEVINNRKPRITASFKGGADSYVDTETIRVYLNNEPIHNTLGFEAFEGGFAFVPREDLPVGENSVKAGFRDTEGRVAEVKWYFKIDAEDLPPVEDKKEDNNNIYSTAILTILLIAGVCVASYYLIKHIQENNNTKLVLPKRPVTPKKITPLPGIVKKEKETKARQEKNVSDDNNQEPKQEADLKFLKEKEIKDTDNNSIKEGPEKKDLPSNTQSQNKSTSNKPSLFKKKHIEQKKLETKTPEQQTTSTKVSETKNKMEDQYLLKMNENDALKFLEEKKIEKKDDETKDVS